MSTFAKSPSCKLGLFMVDFDNTCNMRDTTELFYKASQTYQSANDQEKKLLDAKWLGVQQRYLADYNKLILGTLETFSNQTAKTFDQDGLVSFLKVIANFNAVATEDVENSQLIVGADTIGLKLAAKKVILYPGCFDLLKMILSHVRVVSVNWSAEFIGYSFNDSIPEKNIYANHLLGKNGLSNGKIGKEMISSFDKKSVMQMLLAKKEIPGASIFVGDAITDLLCLIEADFGVIIGDSKSLLKTASTFGIDVIPLAEVLQNNAFGDKIMNNCKRCPTLLKANSWYEIEELVRKLI